MYERRLVGKLFVFSSLRWDGGFSNDSEAKESRLNSPQQLLNLKKKKSLIEAFIKRAERFVRSSQ